MSQSELDIEQKEGVTTHQIEERNRIRETYRARLAEKLKDPEFRKIEGFPIGTDEAILALSDPPYYTACPNPFIEEWLQENAAPYNAATDNYRREPFAADVSEGKNDPIYNAHSYHTKVPHKAIMRYILHYTEPGDVVYDGFCGTGMTGVAAQMCGNKAQVESLGYKIQADGTILDEKGKPFSKFGARKAILNDLSPAATFIACNYNTPVDAAAFEKEAKRILKEVEEECGWMYSALHDASPEETERVANAVRACRTADELRELYKDLLPRTSPLRDENSKLQIGRINYTVWSDVFLCPSCDGEIVFWEAAVDKTAGKVLDTFACPSCRAETVKRKCARAKVSRYDDSLKQTLIQAKQVPVLLNFSLGKKRHESEPDAHDRALIEKIESLPIPYWFPTEPIMGVGKEWGDTWRSGVHFGITHTHHFYTRRNLWVLAAFFGRASSMSQRRLILLVTASLIRTSRMYKYMPTIKSGKLTDRRTGTVSGTLYIPSLSDENSPYELYFSKIEGLKAGIDSESKSIVQIASCTTKIAENASDYIFTDPPFGGNLMYSELNFLWESWLRVVTNSASEAITNESQKKKLPEYQALMTRSFAEYYRVLKPGRWMTVEFHNSANAVWNAIQEGLERVGFIVADVRVLSKQQGTFKQVTSAGAVKEDLVISCYKPHHAFEERFRELQGKPEGVVEFLREHLAMLPVAPINKTGKLESVAERTKFLLFDRMIAYHLQRGARIPMSAVEFYGLLGDQFIERDEMYFLPEQAARYDAQKAKGLETEQLSIFVCDEKTAVQWVRAELSKSPQTLGDLTPKLMQELHEWVSHEPRPELRDLLREYFIENDGFWRVPDLNNEKDLEAVRKNAMLKLFREYAAVKGPLKTFRKEAVLAGFLHCWQTHQYRVIVRVCEAIPDKILQEIHEFVQLYDIAKDMAPPEIVQAAFVWE